MSGAKEGPTWTKGEWQIAPHAEDDTVLHIVSNYEVMPGGVEKANWIAEVDLQEDDAENRANANLLSAAPELYEALRRLLEAYDEPLDDESDRAEAARAALAKARGEK